MTKPALAVGDSVVVRPGVTDADLGGDLGGWQGRIAQIHPMDPPTLDIRWDSITLQTCAGPCVARASDYPSLPPAPR